MEQRQDCKCHRKSSLYIIPTSCIFQEKDVNKMLPFIENLDHEASSDPFFLPCNEKLTQEVDSTHLSIKFINFEKKYEKLSDFTLMQTFNFTTLSNNDLDKFASKIP